MKANGILGVLIQIDDRDSEVVVVVVDYDDFDITANVIIIVKTS